MSSGNNDFYIDLHVHTNCSDGVFSPSQAVAYASKVKLAAISITDHDCVDGIDEAVEASSKYGIEIIPGIELSSQVPFSPKKEMHILGYYIDHKSDELTTALAVFKEARQKRAKEILAKLKKHGIDIKDTDFIDDSQNKAVGRLHFAKALMEEGYVNSVSEAFRNYLSEGKPAYVPKYAISASDTVKLIRRAGGVPVMAHPYYAHYSDKTLLQNLVDDGLAGLEAMHTKHTDGIVKKIMNLSKEFDIIATGGSDCHGPYKDDAPLMGTVKVPYSVLEQLCRVKEMMK